MASGNPESASPFPRGYDREAHLAHADEVYRAIRSRRTFKGGLSSDPIPEEYIERILEAARWAPSGANTQPWEVIVVKERELIQQIGLFFTDGFTKMKTAQPDFPVDNKKYMCHVPLMLVVIGDKRFINCYPQVGGWDGCVEIFYSSLAAFVQNIHLMACALGLGSTWGTCFSFHEINLKKLLGIPDIYRTFAVIPIGWPRAKRKDSWRKPVASFVHAERYDPARLKSTAEFREWIGPVRYSRLRSDGSVHADPAPAIEYGSLVAWDVNLDSRYGDSFPAPSRANGGAA